MTIDTNTYVTNRSPSRWQRLQSWLAYMTESMDYDPFSHTRSTIEKLESRISSLETTLTNRDQ